MKSKVIGSLPENGLSHFLSIQCQLEDVLCQTNSEKLFTVLSGAVPPNPTELLSTDAMKKLVAFCREHFDYVIIDTPPIGMVVDAAVIAPLCDGVVILIEANEVKYRLAQEVVAKMKATDCPILGVVLNKVDYKTNGKNYGKYYGKKYKGYYS